MSVPIEQSNSLTDLAARINAEHAAVRHHMKQGLERAITAGRLLLEAKGLVEHGEWLPWLEKHCQIPERTAQHYMRLAKHEDEIRKSADLDSDAATTIGDAMAVIAAPNDDIAQRQEGRRLADNIRRADCNLAEVVIEKLRDLRRYAEFMGQLAHEDQLEVLRKVNKEPADWLGKITLMKLAAWRRMTEAEMHRRAWAFVADMDAPDDDDDFEATQ